MRIGILKVDRVHEELVEFHKDYDHMFRQLFLTIRPDWHFKTYDVIAGELPSHLAECHGYLITGSQYSTYDGFPWIKPLEDFIRHCDAHRKKLIGICFGHQLIAQALGGHSQKSERGWGVGIREIQLTDKMTFLSSQPSLNRMIYTHQDQVQQLPPHARLLGGSAHCPIGMYQIGEHIWCCQGHPEFNEAYAEAIFSRREEILGKDLMDEAIASLQNGTDRLVTTLWMAQFFEST